jgi:hypothetical protein
LMLLVMRLGVTLAGLVAATAMGMGAASAADYSDSHLMDDAIFDNVNSMSEQQIRDFINSRPSSCLAISGAAFPEPITYWQYGGNVDAARVIYNAAHYNDINPQVILAELQKEQTLITRTSCFDGAGNDVRNKALGMGCFDGQPCPTPAYAGFHQQVMKGAWVLGFARQRAVGNVNWGDNGSIVYGGPWTEGNRAACLTCTSVYRDGYWNLDGQSIKMETAATASLYRYTPHLGQSFPSVFEGWFGSVRVPTYAWSVVSQTYSKGSTQITSTDKETITLVAKNTGNLTWTNTGAHPVRLGTSGPIDRGSAFYDPSWSSAVRPANLTESSVAPGANGTFTFTIQAPRPGNYTERFNLVAEGAAWFGDPGMYFSFSVNPAGYGAQWVSDTMPTALNANATQSVTVTMKNTGNVTWWKAGYAPAKLGTYGHNSVFADSSWESPARADLMNEASVAPGANATFTFTMRAPNVAEPVSDNFRMVIEGWAWVDDAFAKTVSVIGPYTATAATPMVNVTVPAGDYVDQTLSFTNVGTATWSNSGSVPVKLGLAGQYGRTSSAFRASTWAGDSRPDILNEASVAPSATGTFNLRLRAPMQTGTYTETFAPVAEGIAWVKAPVTFTITVVPATYSWQVVSQAYGAGAAVSPGQVQTVTLVAKNTGNTTWHNTSTDSFPIRVATSNPRSRTSAFYDSSWLSAARPTALQESSVAPGANGTFTFQVLAPASGSNYHEYFSLVAEGVAWFNDPGMYFNFDLISSYSWQLMSQSYSLGNINIAPLGTETVTLMAKNTGASTWYNSGPLVMKLATSSPRNRSSKFYAPSWPGTTRAAVLQESSVAPGANGTFSFIVQAPAISGRYSEPFSLVLEGLTWLNDPGAYFDFNVQ